MEKITITREEFRQRIINNPKGYGIVRDMRKDPEKVKEHGLMLALEELTQKITLKDVEEELFGPEE